MSLPAEENSIKTASLENLEPNRLNNLVYWIKDYRNKIRYNKIFGAISAYGFFQSISTSMSLGDVVDKYGQLNYLAGRVDELNNLVFGDKIPGYIPGGTDGIGILLNIVGPAILGTAAAAVFIYYYKYSKDVKNFLQSWPEIGKKDFRERTEDVLGELTRRTGHHV